MSGTLLIDGKRVEAPRTREYSPLAGGERGTITCIDGGSGVLLQTPSMVVLYCRIVALTMHGDNRKEIVKREGRLTVQVDEEFTIKANFKEKGKKEELFNTSMKDAFKDVEEGTLLSAANEARKYLEWRMTAQAASNPLTVWDGAFTLRTKLDQKEYENMQELVEKGMVIGLAKTTKIVGSYAQFFENAPVGAWSVPVGGSCFVKLHAQSRHIFRADSGKLALLVPWAKDPVFLGYPYPLVLVDQLARVSEQERLGQRARFMTELGEQWQELAKDETAVNAHEILDNIQF